MENFTEEAEEEEVVVVEEERCKEGRRFLRTGLPWAQRRPCIRYLEAYIYFFIFLQLVLGTLEAYSSSFFLFLFYNNYWVL